MTGAAGSGGDDNVVWLHGEHDSSTSPQLCDELARVIAADEHDVVVDLSCVRSMGVVTVRVLDRARIFLGQRSRRLVLRSPSPCAQRILDFYTAYLDRGPECRDRVCPP